MKSPLIATTIVLSILGSRLVQAQEPPEFPGPVQEHQWLQKFVGQWETKSKGSMGPDQPTMECTGRITGRMLGGLWLINEMQGDVMGTQMLGLQTIGYDPVKKKYAGTWVDSMMNHMWVYEGWVDESGNKLVLEADGPNFMAGGKLTKFRDGYEFTSPDHIVVTSSMLGEDGKWVTFMTGDATRTK